MPAETAAKVPCNIGELSERQGNWIETAADKHSRFKTARLLPTEGASERDDRTDVHGNKITKAHGSGLSHLFGVW